MDGDKEYNGEPHKPGNGHAKSYEGKAAIVFELLISRTSTPWYKPPMTKRSELPKRDSICGQFVDRLKFKGVVLHSKKGSRHLLDNYWPVCHPIQLDKLVELAVWYQLMYHCMQKLFLHPNHHDSLPWNSTTTALSQMYDILMTAAEQMMSAMFLLDQSSAFDLVVHCTLTAKMSALNVSQNAIRWFQNYLAGRFSCHFESTLSHPLDVRE